MKNPTRPDRLRRHRRGADDSPSTTRWRMSATTFIDGRDTLSGWAIIASGSRGGSWTISPQWRRRYRSAHRLRHGRLHQRWCPNVTIARNIWYNWNLATSVRRNPANCTRDLRPTSFTSRRARPRLLHSSRQQPRWCLQQLAHGLTARQSGGEIAGGSKSFTSGSLPVTRPRPRSPRSPTPT
jgi:hypothetical protein